MVEPHQFANELNNFYLSRGINPSSLFPTGVPPVHPQVRLMLADGTPVYHPQLLQPQDKGPDPNVTAHLPQQLSSQAKQQTSVASHMPQSSQSQDKAPATTAEQFLHSQDKPPTSHASGAVHYTLAGGSSMHYSQSLHPHDKMQINTQQSHLQENVPPGGGCGNHLSYNGREKMQHHAATSVMQLQQEEDPGSGQHTYHGSDKMQAGPTSQRDKDQNTQQMTFPNQEKLRSGRSEGNNMAAHAGSYTAQGKMQNSNGNQPQQQMPESLHQQRGPPNQQPPENIHGMQQNIEQNSATGLSTSLPQPFFTSPSLDQVSSPMCLSSGEKAQPLNCSLNASKQALMANIGGYHTALLSSEILSKFAGSSHMQLPISVPAKPELACLAKKEKKTAEKCHTCLICAKSFTQPDKLKKHEKTHNSFASAATHSEKTYACNYCDKIFSRSDKLTRHVRTHTGEKPYACTVCEKAFSRTDKLLQHSRTHTGEKPYSCDFCGKAYTRKDKMLLHKQTHDECYVRKKPERSPKKKKPKVAAAVTTETETNKTESPTERTQAPTEPPKIAKEEEGNRNSESQEMRAAQWPVLPGPFAFVQSQLMTPVFPNFIPQQP